MGRRRASSVALLSVAIALLGLPVHASVLDPRDIQSETLANGLRLIICADPDASVVSVEVTVKAGSADEQAGERGIAHLLEHVLWAGAGDGEHDPRIRIERIGGVTNGGTLRDFTRFYATVPSVSLDLAVDALGDVVVRAQIDPGVLVRQRQVIAEEIAARQEDARAAMSDAAFALVYGSDSPYGSPVGGSASDLGKVDQHTLSLFRERWYVPNNMAIIVSGAATFDEARAAVLRSFGAMAPAPLPGRAPAVLDRSSAKRGSLLSDPAVPRAYVMAAFAGPEGSDHNQVCATDVIATLLAYDPIGRLVVDLREQQRIADEVGVDFLTQRQQALFGVWAVCSPGDIEEVKTGIRSELARLAREPVSVAELAAAKRLLAAGYAFANETPSDRASTLSFYEAIDDYRAASHYLSWVADISPQMVMAMAARYAGEPTWIILTPKSADQ